MKNYSKFTIIYTIGFFLLQGCEGSFTSLSHDSSNQTFSSYENDVSLVTKNIAPGIDRRPSYIFSEIGENSKISLYRNRCSNLLDDSAEIVSMNDKVYHKLQDSSENLKVGRNQYYVKIEKQGEEGNVDTSCFLLPHYNYRNGVVKKVVSTASLFSVLTEEGTVYTWGDSGAFDESEAHELYEISDIVSNEGAFAAIKDNGEIITWGSNETGGDTGKIKEDLVNVVKVVPGQNSFSAIKNDGSIVTWGGDSYNNEVDHLVDVKWENNERVVSFNDQYFLLNENEAVVSWGRYSSATNSLSESLVGVIDLIATNSSYAALKEDGSVISWGNANNGGDSDGVKNQLSNVLKIHATDFAFAALKADGTLVTWGNDLYGGDASAVATQLTDIVAVESNRRSFAAIKSNGKIISWGGEAGEDYNELETVLIDYKDLYATDDSFLLVKQDNSIVIWGNNSASGTSGVIYNNLKNVYTTSADFLILNSDGSFVTYGRGEYDQDPSNKKLERSRIDRVYDSDHAGFVFILESGEIAALGTDEEYLNVQVNDVLDIKSSLRAQAVITKNGNIVTWGDPEWGADISEVEEDLDDIKDIQVHPISGHFNAIDNNNQVFPWGIYNRYASSIIEPGNILNVKKVLAGPSASAALFENGGGVVWGAVGYGGNSPNLNTIKDITVGSSAMAAIENDDTVISWGNSRYGGDISEISDSLVNVKKIYTTGGAFAALKNDGTVTTWGGGNAGGDSASVSSQLTDVIDIKSTKNAFAAIKSNGEVVSWSGNSTNIMNFDMVKSELTNLAKVVGGANHFYALREDGRLFTWGNYLYNRDYITSYLNSLENVNDIQTANNTLLIVSDDSWVHIVDQIRIRKYKLASSEEILNSGSHFFKRNIIDGTLKKL